MSLRMRVPRHDWTLIGVAALTAVAFALRLRGLNEGLYHDELITYAELHGRSFTGMLDAVANGASPGAPVENTPPLHFTLAWLTSKLGDPTATIRWPSIVLGAATVPVVYAAGRRTVGTAASLVGAGFIALSPFAVFYGIDARAYGALMFFAALSALVLLEAVDRRRTVWWVAYAASVAAVIYTHYTGAVVLATEVGWVLWTRRELWRPLALAYAAALAVYLPWLPHVHNNPAEYDELAGVVGVHDWEAFLQWVTGSPELLPRELPATLALILLGTGAAIGLAGAVATRAAPWRSQGVALVLLLAVTTPIVLLINGLVGDDLFVYPRNMSAALPFVALAVGWLVTRPPVPIAAVAVGLVAVALGIGAAKTLEDRFHRPDSPGVARALDSRLGPGQSVVYYGPGFDPFVIGDLLRLYYDERHPARGANVSTGSLSRALNRVGSGQGPVPVVAFEYKQPEPVVAGWDQIARRSFAGHPTFLVSDFAPLSAERYRGLKLTTGAMQGAVDSAAQKHGTLTVSGWALTRDSRPVSHVLAYVGTRLVAAGLPNRDRPDVAKSQPTPDERVGFLLELPATLDKSERARIQVFATDGRVVSVLNRYCSARVRFLLGCRK
jgi:4-amino-4-deoxy-L-arabinose transferase-like glycosyltransferase